MRSTLHYIGLTFGLVLCITAAAMAVFRRHPLDGDWIAFLSSRDTPGHSEIYRMWSDGTHIERLTYQNTGQKAGLAASRDGAWLYFESNHEGNTELYRMRTNGRAWQRITYQAGYDVQPALSPNGTALIFFSDRYDAPGLYTIHFTDDPIDGTAGAVPGLTVGAWSPSWSPDSEWIVYQRIFDGTSDIAVMHPDGTQDTRLTQGHHDYDAAPAWSPDGEWIVFTRQRVEGNFQIYRMRPDGSDQELVTPALVDAGSLYDPSWSPDGASIAFWKRDDLNSSIYAIDIDGSNLRRITSGSNDSNPVWLPKPDFSYRGLWLVLGGILLTGPGVLRLYRPHTAFILI